MKPLLCPVQIILCDGLDAAIEALGAGAGLVAETYVPRTMHTHTIREQISFSIADIPVSV
jgi:hypothetical protein